jgi:hypothetical protein
MPGPAGPFELEQNGSSSASLPQFNLSPSGRHDSDASKDVDMKAEELDTMGEMPPVAGIGRAGTRMGPSPTRKSRLSSTTRAAGSLQKSFTAMSDSGLHGEFNTEVGEMHCDPCHCIYSWQAGHAPGDFGGAFGSLVACNTIDLELAMPRECTWRLFPVCKPRTVVQGLLFTGCLPPEPWVMRLCAVA